MRAGWKMARWLDEAGRPLDLIATLGAAHSGRIDRPIKLWPHKRAEPLAMRLVAIRKPEDAAEKSKQKVRREAARECDTLADETLVAAEWVLLLTSLSPDTYSADDIAELYRARWRIEMAFKRLKSLVGLGGPPSQDAEVAKTWILAHLLMILLLEPHTAVVEDSPHLGPQRRAA